MSDVVTKADVISGNRYLTDAEMEINAQYVWQYLGARGWSINAVAAMLGNMVIESNINPELWESLTVNTERGFGLVQWTPATKLMEWCNERGLDYTDIDAQLERIIYEFDNGIQYYETDDYPISASEFRTSSASPQLLAAAFMVNYERPKVLDTMARRQTLAAAWYTLLSGNPAPVLPSKKGGMPLLLMYLATRRL